jgi:hypothetical protein
MTDVGDRSRVRAGVRYLGRLGRDVARRLPRPAPRARVSVLCSREPPALLPAHCACCGAMAAESLREPGPSGATVIVPYCSGCHFHATSAGTRRLAVALSSLLVMVTFTVGLPLLGVHLAFLPYMLGVVLAAAVPVTLGAVAWTEPELGHSAWARAVWWRSDGALVCTHASWAEALAELSGGSLEHERRREPLLAPVVFVGVALGILSSPLAYRVAYPSVRVLNLTPGEVTIVSDGRQVATLAPTSQESPRAGATVRLPFGGRRLTAVGASGHVVDRREVRLGLGRDHLYAPAAEGFCFWLERTPYGRVGGPSPDRLVEPLGRGGGFWGLSRTVDTWFSPNPGTGVDGRSTGGELTALRQAPCLDAPGVVRAQVPELPAFAPPDK